MMDPGSHGYEELKCPVCFEIPEDKIFLCQNGHTLCGQCSTSIKICPQCRVSLATVKVRNRSMEVLLDNLKFGCSNKELGCQEKLGRKDIKRHLIDCIYSGKRIDFCKKIGFHNCDYSTNLRNLQAAMHHYRNCHDATIYGERNFPVLLANFDKAALLKRNAKYLSSKWSPVIIDLSLGGGASSSNGNSSGQINSNAKLMLLSNIHGKDRSASWMVVCLSPEPEAAQFHVEFCIKSLSSQVPDLSWRTPTIDATQMDAMFHLSPFRFPVHLLLNHYVSKTDAVSNLMINLRIIRINGKQRQAAQMADHILVFNRDADEVRPTSFSNATRPGPGPGPNNPRSPVETYTSTRNGIILGHSDRCNCLQCWQFRLN